MGATTSVASRVSICEHVGEIDSTPVEPWIGGPVLHPRRVRVGVASAIEQRNAAWTDKQTGDESG